MGVKKINRQNQKLKESIYDACATLQKKERREFTFAHHDRSSVDTIDGVIHVHRRCFQKNHNCKDARFHKQKGIDSKKNGVNPELLVVST